MGQTRSNGIIGGRAAHARRGNVPGRAAGGRPAGHGRLAAGGSGDDRPQGPAAAARSLALAVVCGGAAAGLADLAAHRATAGRGADAMVAAGVMALGALAAAWLTLGCVGLLLRAVLAAIGRVPDVLDRVLVATTPRALRRCAAWGAGVGLALAPLGGPAFAADPPPALGWQVTDSGGTSTEGRDAAPTAAPDAVPGTSPTQVPRATPTTGADPSPGPADAAAPAMSSPVPAGPATDVSHPATPAASPTPNRPGSARTVTVAASPAPLAPSSAPPAAAPPVAAPPAAVPAPVSGSIPAPATVVVRAGDCLWSIAAAHLPADASDADVAAAWPAWYRANATTIGADPDVLLPGQVLVVPQVGAP